MLAPSDTAIIMAADKIPIPIIPTVADFTRPGTRGNRSLMIRSSP
jgi:hypothetical protein